MRDAQWGDGDQSSALIRRWLTVRLALAAIPLGLTAFVLISNVGWPIKVVIAVALGVSVAAPVHGLLLVAIVAPLGELIASLIGAPSFRIGEAVVLAFLGGWLLRGHRNERGPRVPAAALGWLLASTIVGSVTGLAWQLGRYPGELPAEIDRIAHIYFFIVDRIGVVDAARLIEGLGLVAATVMLFRVKPALSVTLPLALAASASLAALSSALLWYGVGSAAAVERYRRIGYRLSGHVGDVNAAGSYFAMIACLALGMALRERGGRRAAWIVLAGASGAGLWFSESRSALAAAAAVLAVTALWAATTRFSTLVRGGVLTAVVLAILGAGALRARLLETDPTYRGAGFREQFFQTSVRMIAHRPAFGLGIGQYNRMSALFLSPQLAWTYGFENAHNYFLQIGGDLGLVGLGLFILWIGATVARTTRAVAFAPRDWRLLGAGGGVMVFIGTCLTGHPLLIGEVAYPFWIQLGLVSALAGSTLLNRDAIAGESAGPRGTPRSRPILIAAALAILASSSIATARVAAAPPVSTAVDGFYGWEALEDGTKFRWTSQYASLFVPADTTRVEVPIRLPTDGRTSRSMGVEVMTGGTDRGRTMVDATWAIVSVRLPDAVPPTRFKRIDLRVDRLWRPALYIAGSADMRNVGVQVGEPRLFRD